MRCLPHGIFSGQILVSSLAVEMDVVVDARHARRRGDGRTNDRHFHLTHAAWYGHSLTHVHAICSDSLSAWPWSALCAVRRLRSSLPSWPGKADHGRCAPFAVSSETSRRAPLPEKLSSCLEKFCMFQRIARQDGRRPPPPCLFGFECVGLTDVLTCRQSMMAPPNVNRTRTIAAALQGASIASADAACWPCVRLHWERRFRATS
ncbi:hypothetical protein IWZ03DRAFT_72355 [Phyllosticta citriasiana]|uniref:Uncharacterized protein n=1 Tax=Phyllosticta citriasiana TaxID=595635 RepID=A0ABR1KG41_9PEZI